MGPYFILLHSTRSWLYKDIYNGLQFKSNLKEKDICVCACIEEANIGLLCFEPIIEGFAYYKLLSCCNGVNHIWKVTVVLDLFHFLLCRDDQVICYDKICCRDSAIDTFALFPWNIHIKLCLIMGIRKSTKSNTVEIHVLIGNRGILSNLLIIVIPPRHLAPIKSILIMFDQFVSDLSGICYKLAILVLLISLIVSLMMLA